VPQVGEPIVKEHSMRFVAETNTGRLRSFVKHHVTDALISLTLGGIASLAGAQVATPPESSTSPAAAITQDQYFAADLSAEQAAFMARSQVLNAAVNFKAVITTPAWRSRPSWMLVAAKDRTINPDLERWYAERAHSHTVEVASASHSVYVSHPKEVADVIESAARAVLK
jgi:pimeloyl-ACP methyl ester carboxylesterase